MRPLFSRPSSRCPAPWLPRRLAARTETSAARCSAPTTAGDRPRAESPAGPPRASNANQGKRVKILVGSNTTIVGLPRSSITGAQIELESVRNVILRNLTIRDAYTCFPGWNGDAWKTEWDSLALSRTSHVWIDHVTIDDGDHPDAAEPLVFGQPLLRHDGLLDITRQSDLVTISWSKFSGHDKSMLWGNSDTPSPTGARSA